MIGIFDSGVGGLTVAKEIFKTLPQYQIIYFGDTAHLPYGTKGPDFVKRCSEKISQWLLKKGAKLIIVACHTSSAWASEFLKERFAKLPIFEMISPSAKEAVLATNSKRIGIIGTPGTIKSRAWEKKVLSFDSSLKIYSKSCPLFVPLVEEGWLKKEITRDIAKVYLAPLVRKRIDTLILACTHYPLLTGAIRKTVGDVSLVNPSKGVARQVKNFLHENPQFANSLKKGKNHKFFFSDAPYNLPKISRYLLGRQIKFTVKDIF